MRSLKELMNLSGRVAAITGGAGHIGSSMAEALAELGAAIVVIDIQAEATEQVAAMLHTNYSVETLPLVVNVEHEAQLLTVPGMVTERFGRLDILINCAVLLGPVPGYAVPIEQQRIDTWRRALEINLTAPFILTQACLPLLRASGHGSVINIGSIYGEVGPDMSLYEGTEMGNPAAYGATKGGLAQLTRYFATMLAPDIRVNMIVPGGVWREQPEAFHKRYVARTPMHRMAIEEDFKGAAAYLASDLSAYVTGQMLRVDGGWSVW